MSVTTFTNNAQITARSAFQVSQAIAYNTYTAAVIARDHAIAAWHGTASHRRIAGIIARASWAGVIAAAPHAGRACLQLIAVTIALGALAYQRGAQFRTWCDALVEECQQAPAVPEIEPEPSPEPEPVATPPAPNPEPALTSTPAAKPAAPSPFPGMSRDQLRSACRRAGIQWRNAKGTNQHLTVEEMRSALAAAVPAV